MVGFRIPGPCLPFVDDFHTGIDAGIAKRKATAKAGPVGLHSAKGSYSYSISGNTGALGWILFTESHRLPGTWYDRTDATNKLRSAEAELGMSKYANEEFRRSAKITKQNITSPSKVDVDIHFKTVNRVESITVRGQHDTRSFRFDFNEVSKMKLPAGADPMKPFMDVIDKIFTAIFDLR